MKEQLRLEILINVFMVSPTFLLPVYKDLFENKYYTQKAQSGKITNFELVDIDYFKQCESKFNIINHNKTYSVGDEALYAIEFENGVIWGNSKTIVSFYHNNSSFFNDKDFEQYMAEFIRTRIEPVVAKKNALVLKMSSSLQTPFSPDFSNSSILYHLLHSIDSKLWGSIKKTTDLVTNYLIMMTKYNSENYDGELWSKIFEKYIHKDTIRTLFINSQNSPMSYISLPDTSILQIENKFFDKQYKSLNNDLGHRYFDFYQMLFDKPPVVKLWNDDLIKGFTNYKDFILKIPLEYSVPLITFDEYDSDINDWVYFSLPDIINEARENDFLIFWLSHVTISAFEETQSIVAQDFNSGKNYFKLYKRTPYSKELIDFINDLIADCYSKICFITTDKIFDQFVDVQLIDFLDNNKRCNIVMPPKQNWSKAKKH